MLLIWLLLRSLVGYCCACGLLMWLCCCAIGDIHTGVRSGCKLVTLLSFLWNDKLWGPSQRVVTLLYWKTFLEQENCLNIKFDSIQLALHTSGVNQKDGCTFMVHCTDWKAAAWQRTDGCPPGPLNRTNPCSYFVGNFLYKSISFIETRLVRGKVCHLPHIQKKKSISYRRRITFIRSTD